MNKFDFFILAMKAGLYGRVAWVISAFSKIQEDPEEYKKDPYSYRIVQTPTNYMFVDPLKNGQLSSIDATENVSEPLFNPRQKVVINGTHIENLTETITSCYGNLLFNYECLVYPFGSKIPYMNGRVSSAQLEAEVLKYYQEVPLGEKTDTNSVTTLEYLKMRDAVFHLENYMQLFTPAGSEHSMVTDPRMLKLRDELFEKYKDKLHDPATFALISKELENLDRAWIKEDPDSFNFYLKSKSYKIVRRKLFETLGADAGFSDGVSVTPVKRSLQEGWDDKDFAQLNDVQRAGSYSRGAETALGGEQVKWLLRASSNMVVTEEDCGSSLGVAHVIDSSLLGFRMILGNTQEDLTKENISTYLGKSITLRSPMFCKLEGTKYCKTCVGPRLALNPTSMFTSISRIGDTMLSISLAAAHSTAVEVETLDTLSFLS